MNLEEEIDLKVKNNYYINWGEFSRHRDLTEGIIRKYSNQFDWFGISYSFPMSENFMVEFSYKLNFCHVFYKQKLSAKLLKTFLKKLDIHYWNWIDISACQKLSKSFIKEFSNKIYFRFIPICYFNFAHEKSWRTFL